MVYSISYFNTKTKELYRCKSEFIAETGLSKKELDVMVLSGELVIVNSSNEYDIKLQLKAMFDLVIQHPVQPGKRNLPRIYSTAIQFMNDKF